MKKEVIIGIIALGVIIVGIFVLGDFSFTGKVSDNSLDEEIKNHILTFLYEMDYCYEGMEEDGKDICGDVKYPNVGIFNGETYKPPSQLTLVARLVGSIRTKFPETVEDEVIIDFVDGERKIIERYIVKGDVWRTRTLEGTLYPIGDKLKLPIRSINAMK
jgi:hypothetical protein